MEVLDFNCYSSDYVKEVEKSISFIGIGQEFFTRVKSGHILGLARARLGDPGKLKILDVGCGIGLTDRFLCDHVGELHGVDVAEESVEQAKKNVPSGQYRAYDGQKLPYKDQIFDLAFCVCVLHHVPLAQRAVLIAEMARVVRKGGMVAAFEHNPLNPLTRLAVFRCKFDRGAKLLIMSSTKKLLSSHDLHVVETRYIFASPFVGKVWLWVDSALRGVPTGAQYFVVAIKATKPQRQ